MVTLYYKASAHHDHSSVWVTGHKHSDYTAVVCYPLTRQQKNITKLPINLCVAQRCSLSSSQWKNINTVTLGSRKYNTAWPYPAHASSVVEIISICVIRLVTVNPTFSCSQWSVDQPDSSEFRACWTFLGNILTCHSRKKHRGWHPFEAKLVSQDSQYRRAGTTKWSASVTSCVSQYKMSTVRGA